MGQTSKPRPRRIVARRTLSALTLSTALVPATSVPASADVYSRVGYLGVHNGVEYRNQASLDTGPQTIAFTRTWTNKTVAIGRIGSEGRLYRQSGALCKTDGMIYNFQPASTLRAGTSKGSACGSGYFYSYGKSATWTGSGYKYYWTYRTPNEYVS